MKQVSLRDLFLTFAKIGAFTIGGGAAMIALLREEIVKRGWISDEEFPDILAIAQSSPGLLAVNFSIFAGYRIRGTKGSIVATIGSCIPPFLIILLIAMFFSGFRDNPTVMSIFRGIRPAVTAIIAVPMIQMAMETNHSRWAWAATLAVLGLVAFLKISPIWILLVTILVSFAIALYRDKREGRRK
ncbi:MAG: chromate transporter [Bacteroidales bacterium]|nr:chromate transporter [Bacteroidales bacterium]